MTEPSQDPLDPIFSDLVRDDPGFADLVEEFLDTLPQRLADIEAALRTTDFEALQRYAHQLKGSGGGYGYPALTELAARVEQDARSHEIDTCSQGLDDLKALVARLSISED